MPLSNRIDFQPQIPYRKVEHRTSKIIFLSCEGAVTEEGYFKIISELFSEAKAKIEIISVMQDIVQKIPKYRTEEEFKTCRDEFEKQESIRWPHTLGTTVYKLLDEIVEIQRQMSL